MEEGDSTPSPQYEPHYSGGGILIIAYLENVPHMLLGAERNGLYEDFGGSRDRGEIDPRITARRECYEESAKLVDIPIDRLSGSPYVFEAAYYQFWVRCDEFLEDGPESFPKRFLESRETCEERVFQEKQNLRWFPVPTLVEALVELKPRLVRRDDGSGRIIFPKRLRIPFVADGEARRHDADEDANVCYLRRHLIKMLLKAHELGMLGGLETGEIWNES